MSRTKTVTDTLWMRHVETIGEKKTKEWLFHLQHYIYNTGEHASRRRALLRKYHPNQDYICECGCDEKRRPFVRYRLVQQFEKDGYNIEAGIAWWEKLIKDNPGHKIIPIAEHEIFKLKKKEEYLWLGLVYP